MALIVTGAQRSGTSYIATVLHRAGLDATHEGNPPGQGWRDHDPREGPRTDVDIDVCWHSSWWLSDLDGVTVVHLVRDPLASIASSATRRTFWRPRPSGAWAIDRIPAIGEGTNLQRCVTYWVEWNQLVEPHAHARLRVEDATAETLSALLDRAGVDHDRADLAAAIDDVPKNTNTNRRVPQPLAWDDLGSGRQAARARQMAARYGY